MSKKPKKVAEPCERCNGTGWFYLETEGYNDGIKVGGTVPCPCKRKS